MPGTIHRRRATPSIPHSRRRLVERPARVQEHARGVASSPHADQLPTVQRGASGLTNISPLTAAQIAMRERLSSPAMADAWAHFMGGYRLHFHAGGLAAAHAFAHRYAATLLSTKHPPEHCERHALTARSGDPAIRAPETMGWNEADIA